MVSNLIMNFSILRSVKAVVLVTVTTVGISYCGYAQDNKKPTVALVMKSLANEFF
jgi:ABC-type sugar transport system substrate-binding protein